ncbi:23S rRNA (uracil1939-C5)-methyltransferase [Thermoactinomyces sp. DSM 45891]|uniref:23S rRNA (uracil(1939)-C(5))-methyltransferase RlmD n=1 Tax=Thermoactinomyces sp. DSM 45891 TaxID=1761907 RepID=UPI00092312EA|nr:23S rRNA (uracil(1939)-C(5))-methyltransferase RlmD [Thermoactinomyces sp. DSM 45891]SFX18937.1 23S rRNA (uracil1939-C5)-methyltransferase [Thermoactinomyces sp. DSM 45891]
MKRKPPVQVGQVIEVEIHGQGHNGSGVGRYNGFTVFVSLVVPGEKVLAKVTLVKKNYAQADLLEIIEAHENRTEPKCPISQGCGGCQSQHISYPEQLRLKEKQVRDQFERIGGFHDLTIHPIIGMEEPWIYRNKAQVPFGQDPQGEVIAGFYANQSHEIIDLESCYIQHPDNDAVIRFVKQVVGELSIPVYHEKTHTGILRHLMVRIGVHTNEIMVVFVTNGKKLPHKEILISKIREAFPQCRSIVQNVNDRSTNVILGKENILLWGREVIYDTIGDVEFAISPHSFFQVNPTQTEVLYDQVRTFAALTGEETVVDAYCGIGTIGMYVADQAKQVYGVEIVPEAIADATENAKRNQMSHVHFEVGAAEKVMPKWLSRGIRPEVVIVDPPRKGCDSELLDAVVGMKPERVVYVSCNPATLARDAKYLADLGYEMVEIQPVDMFPQTGHVECVAWMKRV